MIERLFAAELYEYLVLLAEELSSIGEAADAARIAHVSRFISGSASELYGEARLALPTVQATSGRRLSQNEQARLRDIIARIENEFRLVGGA